MDETSKVAQARTVRIEPSHDGPTLVAEPSSLAATHVLPPSAAIGAPAVAAALRTTVLPKSTASGAPVLFQRPRYEHRGLLGEGGVGEVVRSMDNDIERVVAIKRLKPDMRSANQVARFVDEIRTVGSLEHPNIVPIHDVGTDEHGQYYFVMKYIDGETLESIITKLRAGDPEAHALYGFERRVEIFLGILEAIAYAHARGVIHRDIKPANVIVGRYGEVTVMDWGIATGGARAAEPAAEGSPEESRDASLFRTRAGTLIGTPAYMSPEQARAERVDERSDVYSLSILFHEMLTLEHYLEKSTTLESMLAGAQEAVPRFASFVDSAHQGPVPAELAHYINKGVSKDPAQRYQSVPEMIDRLRRRAEGDFPIQCPITLVKVGTSAWKRFIDRHPLAVIVLVSVAGLAAVGGAIAGVVRALV